MELFDNVLEEMNKHLSCENQNWLFGAGISCESNIPLMFPLTYRIERQIDNSENKKLYYEICNDLPESYHIEHVLSHIGDFIALADRSNFSCAYLKNKKYSIEEFQKLHAEIIKLIGETVRYGYREEDIENGTPEEIGTIEKPITSIENHRKFVKSFIDSKANLIPRSSIAFFTTNYDTLLEDALSLEKVSVNDGFVGTSIGFWDPGKSYNDTNRINIYKLHGSVDWIKDSEDGLIRTRYGVNYLDESSNLLIYPQATKYVETQKDPFATLFMKFRERLSSSKDHVLICAGYSFGDNHINSEIEVALKKRDNKTILIIFINEINAILKKWLNDDRISQNIFIANGKGIYHGSESCIKNQEYEFSWWKFSSLIDFLNEGEPA